MTTDLETSVLDFLKTMPPKEFVSAREICFGRWGRFPTRYEVQKTEKVLISLWEIYIVEERVSRPLGRAYRLKR